MPLPDTFAEILSAQAWMMHLPRHEARALHSRTRLREAGCRNIALIPGVDGFRDPCAEIAVANGWRFADYLGPGELGNTISLFRVFQRVLLSNRDWVLVFEDDVLPHPDVARLGELWWQETPRDFDILYLGNQLDAKHVVGKVAVAECFCTHAFLVTRDGARKMLARIEKNVASGIDKGDILLIKWQQAATIRHYAWFARDSVPLPYPVSNAIFDVLPVDVIWSGRDTGLFYQNFALGSSIHGEAIVYR